MCLLDSFQNQDLKILSDMIWQLQEKNVYELYSNKTIFIQILLLKNIFLPFLDIVWSHSKNILLPN